MQPARKIKNKSDRIRWRKRSIVRYRLVCPCCRKSFKNTSIRHRSDIKRHEGATLDCARCSRLLIIKRHRIHSFHKYFNMVGKKVYGMDIGSGRLVYEGDGVN